MVATERRVSTVTGLLNSIVERLPAGTSAQPDMRVAGDGPSCDTSLAPAHDVGQSHKETGTAATAPVAERLERTRQINRDAQARYRNRLKVRPITSASAV